MMGKDVRDIYNKVSDLRGEANKWFERSLNFLFLMIGSPAVLVWLDWTAGVAVGSILALSLAVCSCMCAYAEIRSTRLHAEMLKRMREDRH